MLKQDLLSLLITFGVGIVAGVYLYLVGFVPALSNGNWVPKFTFTPRAEQGFVVTGEMYGGCLRANSCSAFEVRSDSSYRFLAAPDEEVITGVVPVDIMNQLERSLGDASLDRFSVAVTPEGCTSFVDGVDYTYTVTLNGGQYVLDTCKTVFPENSSLQESLTMLWEYFEN